MEELKPCPFCGGEVRLEEVRTMQQDGFSTSERCVSHPTYQDVDCILDRMFSHLPNLEVNLSKDWNTRTEHPDLDKLRAEIKRLNDLVRKQGVELMGLKNATRVVTPSCCPNCPPYPTLKKRY